MSTTEIDLFKDATEGTTSISDTVEPSPRLLSSSESSNSQIGAHGCVSSSSGSASLVLPFEVQGLIFQCAVRDQKRREHNVPFEVIISHVSMHWRAVALNTPSLWTTMDIYSAHSLVWIASYLQRSKHNPLNIRLLVYRAEKWKRKREGSFIDPILQLLLPHISRCRNLYIMTYFEQTGYFILDQLASTSMPILERLHVNFTRFKPSQPNSNVSHAPLTIFGSGVPCLKFFETELWRALPPLSGVTTLHMHIMQYDAATMNLISLLDILKGPTSLLHLSIRGITSESIAHIFVTPSLSLDFLRSLRISCTAFMTVSFLHAIKAPALESLWLDCAADAFRIMYDPGYNKFPQLHYLTIEEFDQYYSESFALIFPYITHLSFICLHPSYAQSMGDTLAKYPPVWEHLHTLVIVPFRNAYDSDKGLYETICQIIPARRLMQIPIKTLLLEKGAYNYCETRIRRDLMADDLASLRMEPLNGTNYDEPWWMMEHEDTFDRL